MSTVESVNRALLHLDVALRTEKMSMDEYRARRAKLIRDFEDGSGITEPEAVVQELVDPDITAENPTRPARPEPPPPSAPPAPRNFGVLIAAGIVAVVLLLGAAWIMLGGNDPKSAPTPVHASPDASMPLAAVNDLIDSSWAIGDIEAFLARWEQFDPAAINAVSDDPRLWLLRGEIENRLREARDAQSLGTNDKLSQRIEVIERLQNTVRAP